MYDRILIPTDGSDAGRSAVEHGIGLGRVHGASVHALSVVEEPPVSDHRLAEIREDLKARGKTWTRRVRDRSTAAGVPVVTAVRTGVPAKEILAYAGEHDVDLIVMGTHGRTGLHRYLIGSVTERVVRLADAPVLSVPIDRD